MDTQISDSINHLDGLPWNIPTANVTTNQTNVVHNSFEFFYA